MGAVSSLPSRRRQGLLADYSNLAMRPAAAGEIRLAVCWLADPSRQITANASVLKLALCNLVRNAADALSIRPMTDKRINIEVSGDSRHVSIAVWDNGPGVRPADLERLRQEWPMFTTKSNQRLGWGLYIVRHALRVHQGRLHLESSHGQGFRAEMTLPVRLGA